MCGDPMYDFIFHLTAAGILGVTGFLVYKIAVGQLKKKENELKQWS